MKIFLRLALPLLLISSLLAACAAPIENQSINDAVLKTMVAMNVQGSQTAVAEAAIALATGTMAAIPTQTPTLTPTATPADVWLTIDSNTNCRTGPSGVYDLVTALTQGQRVQSIARNFENNYYFVRLPETNNTCWVWGQYVSIEGDATPLPIFTALPSPTPSPTPTPVPSFAVSYISISSCGTGYSAKLKIVNTGGVAWSSIQMTVRDRTTDLSGSFSSDDFTGYTGCSADTVNADLQPGEEGFVSNITGNFDSDPTGHEIVATITLYSKDKLQGQYLTQEYRFTP